MTTKNKVEKLAVSGGERAVKNPPNEKWIKVTDKVKKAVLGLMDSQVIRIADASGIIAEFESNFSKMVGAGYGLAMSCCTVGLHSAYFAVGVGPGDEVIVPTYTWHASINPIIHCSATPVFCDIDPDSLTADPDDIERKITSKTKAISITHVWGNVCNMDRIVDIAERHKIALIEDCSHAHGASWKGRKVGSFGDVGCFSLHGSKAVSGGECGIVTTNSPEIFDKIVLLGLFGRKKTGCNEEINKVGEMSLGVKYRPHPWAIAMANEDLKRLPELNKRRTENYKYINSRLRDCSGIEVIDPIPGAIRGGYLNFKFKLSKKVVGIVNRERVVEAMVAEGVPVAVDRYSVFPYKYGLLHCAPLYTTFDRRSIGGCFYDPTLTKEEEEKYKQTPFLPNAQDIATRLIETPAFADVTPGSLEEICTAIIKVMKNIKYLADH